MTLTDLEREVKSLPLAERATLLSRVQLTDEERDELDDERELRDPGIQEQIREASAEHRRGSSRPFEELVAELEEERK